MLLAFTFHLYALAYLAGARLSPLQRNDRAAVADPLYFLQRRPCPLLEAGGERRVVWAEPDSNEIFIATDAAISWQFFHADPLGLPERTRARVCRASFAVPGISRQ